MKIRSVTLNVRALQDHFGLTKKQALRVDEYAGLIDLSNTSIYAVVHVDNYVELSVSDEPNCSPNDFGLFVGYYDRELLEDGYLMSFSGAYKHIAANTEHTQHIVYLATMMSRERTTAVKRAGGFIPMPNVEAIGKGRMPFDVATKGRVPFYIGKTSQGMAKRATQHYYSVCAGSNTKFHRALRGSEKYEAMVTAFNIVDRYPTSDEAFAAEEKEIAKSVNLPGMYICNTIGATVALDTLLERLPALRGKVDAEHAEEYLHRSSNDAWDDPEVAEAIICNNPRNFNADDVRMIRFLSGIGEKPKVIANKMNVKIDRVKKLIDGRHYRRIL